MIDLERPVRVFRNWKRGGYNIMQDGRVRATARAVRLADVELLVRESGRRRMLRERRRNVHAYAVGRLVEHVHPDEVGRTLAPLAGRGATYDPWTHATFVDRETGAAVRRAAVVQLDERGLTYADAAPADLPAAA